MKWRVFVLAGLLVIRLIINAVMVSRYRLDGMARVRFDDYKIGHSTSECILRQGRFWTKAKAVCEFGSASIIFVSGKLRSGLIDQLLGRIWLEESSFYRVETGRTERPRSWRERLAEKTLAFLPSPEGELILGIVLGYKSSLPKAFYQELVNSGTVHIVVASGYNVMVAAGLALSTALIFVRRRLATFLALMAVWFYVFLAGGEVSLLRAALMGSLVLIGLAWGRSSRVGWSLALAVGLMLLVSPILIESVSFQLSVAATAGVALVGPFLARLWDRRDPLELTTTLGALLATAPLVWWHFGRLSLISLASNSLILPLVPALMLFGGILITTAVLMPALAGLLVLPSYALAHLMVVLVSFFGR